MAESDTKEGVGAATQPVADQKAPEQKPEAKGTLAKKASPKPAAEKATEKPVNATSGEQGSAHAKPRSGSSKILAAVLVRGLLGVRKETLDALFTLRLRNKHVCVLLEETPQVRGQLRRCKDFITYGTITPETKKQLEEQRGAKNGAGELKPFFRLHPPRGGFERKGVKKSFSEGGVLGDRGAKMDDLVKRML